MPVWISEDGEEQLVVSSRDEIFGLQYGRFKVKVAAPPEDGKANERLIEIIARALGVSKSSVKIVKGETSRIKILKIKGVNRDKLDSFMRRFTN